jgi:hypothetical protein
MKMDLRSISDMGFRPESFFLGQTSGCGIARDTFGRVLRRYAVNTRGARVGAYGGVQVDHTFVFETGDIEVMTWLITPAGDGRYIVAEPEVGARMDGTLSNGDFITAFHRRFNSRFGSIRARFSARMALLEAETAVASIKVSVLGAPFATMTTFHRKVGA